MPRERWIPSVAASCTGCIPMSPEAAKSFTIDSPVISCTCSAQHSTCTHAGALAAVTYHASRYPGAANSIGPVLPHLYVAPIVACTNAIPRTGPQRSTLQERCGGLGLTAFGRRSSTGRHTPPSTSDYTLSASHGFVIVPPPSSRTMRARQTLMRQYI